MQTFSKCTHLDQRSNTRESKQGPLATIFAVTHASQTEFPALDSASLCMNSCYHHTSHSAKHKNFDNKNKNLWKEA